MKKAQPKKIFLISFDIFSVFSERHVSYQFPFKLYNAQNNV